MDCWEASARGCDEIVLSRLWASVRPELRLSPLAADPVPGHYRGGFATGGKSGDTADLGALPGPMRQEVTWCMFRIIELGGRVQLPGAVMLVRRLAEVVADRAPAAPRSLMDLPARTWLQEIPLAVHRRRGKLPGPSSVMQVRQVLLRFLSLLDLACDTRPWWQRDSWHPVEDGRIPLRPHEPLGRQALHFHRITAAWLRRAAQWHGKVALETGALSWSTLDQRVFALTVFDAFLAARGISGPRLAAGPVQVRLLMQDFLGHVRASRASRGQPGPVHGPAGAGVPRHGGAGQRRAVLPVHARSQRRGGRSPGRAAMAGAGSLARRVLAPPGTAPPPAARPRRRHHRRRLHDEDHGGHRPARHAGRCRRARR